MSSVLKIDVLSKLGLPIEDLLSYWFFKRLFESVDILHSHNFQQFFELKLIVASLNATNLSCGLPRRTKYQFFFSK
jgi:hypothetical protein